MALDHAGARSAGLTDRRYVSPETLRTAVSDAAAQIDRAVEAGDYMMLPLVAENLRNLVRDLG